MVDKRTILDLLPHYVVMLALVLLATGALRTALDEVNLAVELGVVVVIVILYPVVVRRLGYAPDVWKRTESGD